MLARHLLWFASQFQYILCDKQQHFSKHFSFKVSTVLSFLSRGHWWDAAGGRGISSWRFWWRLGIGSMGVRTSSGVASALGPGFDRYMTLEPQPGKNYFAALLKWKPEPPHSLRAFFIFPHPDSLCTSVGADYLFPPAPQRVACYLSSNSRLVLAFSTVW